MDKSVLSVPVGLIISNRLVLVVVVVVVVVVVAVVDCPFL